MAAHFTYYKCCHSQRYQRAAHPLSTLRSTLRLGQRELTFFGGQSLESTLQKPVCSLSLALLQEERGVFQPHGFLLTETLQHCVVQFFCLLEGQKNWVRPHRFIKSLVALRLLFLGWVSLNTYDIKASINASLPTVDHNH